MTNTLNLVFSNYDYIVMASTIFILMLVGLLIISEYIFLEPYVVSHIPSGTELGFSLIVILSGLSALVIPMNIYRIRILKSSKKKMGGGVFGSIVGASAGVCSCGPIGFAVISTFGTIGATASAFLTNFEIPIRMVAIGLLLLTYYTTVKSLKVECKINS
ncbi:MAG: hypothetical protein OEL69_09095 [Nitrosopumilus sp.]|nr:hypothetical protein [Nitrosopumilus sp.]